MPSRIWDCLIDECDHGVSLWQELVDWLVPSLLEFLVFGLLVSWIVQRRDARRVESTQQLVRRRLVVLADRFLCGAAAPGAARLSPRQVEVGGVDVTIAFSAWSDGGPVASPSSPRNSAGTREPLADLLAIYGGVLKASELQAAFDFEDALEGIERAIGNEEEGLAATAEAMRSAERLFKSILTKT